VRTGVVFSEVVSCRTDPDLERFGAVGRLGAKAMDLSKRHNRIHVMAVKLLMVMQSLVQIMVDAMGS
jgi:hypothetical protein